MSIQNKKRNGYYYINDKVYPSITKIIGDTIAKPALQYWYAREAVRIALAEPELNEKEVMAKLDLQVRKTADRGKYVHSVAEVMPNIDIDKIRPEYIGYVNALQSWWSSDKPEIIAREIETYSDRLNFGCRVDFVCKRNGQVWLLDFKTNDTCTVYKEVGLQLKAGQIALGESSNIKVERTGAVVLANTGEFAFKETKDTEEDLQALFNLWNWIQRKG
jgi:hypothetical protein